MMYANPKALQASAISLHSSGLKGRHLNGAEDWKKLGLDAADVYLQSGGDVALTFGAALQGASTLTLSLPPPWNIIAGFSASAAADAINATRNYIKVGIAALGACLPLSIAQRSISTIENGWGTSWEKAAKDKLVQYKRTDMNGAVEKAVEIANKQMPSDRQLNFETAARFADYVYKVAIDKGASKAQAAAAAAQTIKTGILNKGNMPQADWAKYNAWMVQAGAKQGETAVAAAQRNAEEEGLKPVTAIEAKKVPKEGTSGPKKKEASGGGAAPLAIGAGLLAILALR